MNHSERIQHIVVVGAGLGGLTAALALLREGFQVTVLEQAPVMGEVGAGLQLSANATRVLSLLGMDEAMEAVAAEVTSKEMRLWSTGQAWKLFDVGAASRERYGHPYYMFHRADLQKALEQAVRSIGPSVIQLDSRCESVDTSGRRPAVILKSGKRVEADLVVGADGVHSRVRLQIVGPDKPRYAGILAWRGVVATDRLPEHMRGSVGVTWVGPGKHFVRYPLRRGRLTNFVGIVEREGWEVESWTQQGSMAECLADFAGWHEDVQTLIRTAETHFKWAFMVREPIERWSSGRMTLLGDAAHPTLPFLAQGACMAIEDGYVLARALAAHRDDVRDALAAYEGARVERTARIVRGSNENASRFHNPKLADAAGAAQYIEEQFAPQQVRRRYEWMFEYKADEILVNPAVALTDSSGGHPIY